MDTIQMIDHWTEIVKHLIPLVNEIGGMITAAGIVVAIVLNLMARKKLHTVQQLVNGQMDKAIDRAQVAGKNEARLEQADRNNGEKNSTVVILAEKPVSVPDSQKV